MTIPFVALLLPVLILMVAFAIDLGRQRSSARTMQAGADVIALDMVRIVEGRTVKVIAQDDAIATQAALSASAARNEVDPAKITLVEWGHFDPAGTPKFTAYANSDALNVPDAVRVTLEEDTDYFWQPGSGHVTRSAVASLDEVAGFQVGTRLVSVSASQAVLLNSVVNQAFGGNLNLTAAGWSGLLNSNISLPLLASQLGFASPDELAAGSVTAAELYSASATVMQNQGNTAAANALGALALQADGTTNIDMGQMLKIEEGGSQAAAAGSLDLYNLVVKSILLFDGTHALSIDQATVAITGTTATVDLDVIEGPQAAWGRVGVQAETEQASITVTATVANLPIVISGLTGVTVSGTIPLSITLGGGIGTLTDVDCGDTRGISVGLAPQPISISGAANLQVRANLIILGNVPIASAVLTSTDMTSLAVSGSSNGASFDYTSEFLPEVGTGTMKGAPNMALDLGGNLNFAAGHITLLNAVAIGAGPIATALNNLVLTPVLDALNANVITAQLNTLLGIDIGGADIGALNMACDGVKLVG